MKLRNTVRLSMLISILTVFAVLLSSCGGAATPASTTGGQSQPAATAATGSTGTTSGSTGTTAGTGQKAKVVYWSMFSEGEPLQILLAQATKDFMAKNPDIEVEVKWAGRQVLTELQSAIAANQQVDIVDHSDDRVFNALVKNGLALPLDKYLSEPAYDSSTPWKDTFLPGSFDQLKGSDGQVYMVPRDDYISAFFYNVKMLDELGIKPAVQDMSWDDFKAMLQTIKEKKPGVSPLGADGTIAFYNNWWFSYLAIRLAGADAFREAAYDKTGEKWSQPEFLQAATMIRELQDAGYFQKGFEGSVWPAAQVDWVNGKSAMMLMGAWLPKEMSEQTPEGFQMSLFGFPSVAGGKGNDMVEHWANVYGVLKNAPNPDAAVKYLKYITSLEIGKKISEAGTPVPLVGAPIPPALENQYAILKSMKQMPARAGLNTEAANYMEKVFNPCDDRFFQMQLTPEQFISCLQTEGKTFWATTQ